MNRTLNRVLAAAVASAGFAGPMPLAIGATLTCTSGSFTASPDGQGNITVSCTQAGSAASCSLSASPATLPASGGSVTLTATNCGTIASWTKAGTDQGKTTTSWSDTFPANAGTSSISFTYTVNGSGGSASALVMQSGTGSTPPPPPGGSISCAGFAKTHVIDIAWGPLRSGNVRVYTSANGGFSNNEIVVARFTTPATTSPNQLGLVQAAEYADDLHPRTAALSTTPCDFPSPNPFGKYDTTAGGTTVFAKYMVGGSSLYYGVMQPSTTYYFNIKNEVNGVSTCAVGQSCNMFVELQKPSGL